MGTGRRGLAGGDGPGAQDCKTLLCWGTSQVAALLARMAHCTVLAVV